ncbi:MAG: GTPase HflX [Planctomycetaceae bacterium]|nr:GTPase HflX [Planctomycetota bacterium]NUN53619.1 GTPase HflX [Planctomycetaceae bacterium]
MKEERGIAQGVVREKVVLVGVERPGDERTVEPLLNELRRLAETAGAVVVDEIVQKRARLSSATFVGKGKAEEIGKRAATFGAGAILFNDDLSPAQSRNLEKAVGRRVVDRSELILDIFALRARSREARVQVELAQYEYLRPRLKRMWTHLERMEGGTGGGSSRIGTRGPGEKQLEVDRRLVARRIQDLKEELEHLDRQHRTRARAREGYFRVSLVGYTNAGKSSLLRALTGAEAFVEDRLFATLDTQTRAWVLPGNKRLFLSDTVGFIRRLPHHLVASFRATLSETLEADLLLHVVDASHPDAEIQKRAVEEVLREIGAGDLPCLLVLNKVDEVKDRISLEVLRRGARDEVVVSALTGEGLDALGQRVQRAAEKFHEVAEIRVDAGDGRTLAWLASRGTVLEEAYEDSVVRVRVRLSRGDRSRLQETPEGTFRIAGKG